MLRWIVESANGRLKNSFRFFDSVIPASYFPKLGKLLDVSIAIMNAFFVPLFEESEWHRELIEMIHERLGKPNAVQQLVEEKELKKKSPTWRLSDQDNDLDFPLLTLSELKMITLGPYQLNIGALYNQEHEDSTNGYLYWIHEEFTGLLRIKLKSRFSNSKRHYVWIQFIPNKNEPEGILGWYCLCKNGARTLGCCGHVAAVSFKKMLIKNIDA